MTRSADLTRKLLIAERARDELQRINFKLRDKILAYAKECLGCDGAGVRNELKDPAWPHLGYRQVPCPVCEDLRELLDH